eukprot:symbB.v1.2.009904.t1/scaffold605.1/size182108/4
MDLSTSNGKLETDRYGVPQYSGDPEQFEEYVERSWDLFYGRDGQDALQTATPLHLRAQLTGPAYEAVRGLDQKKLRTKDGDGHPLPGGMQLFLDTLKSSIAQETPVRVNELFLAYFYSPNVWRRSSETMAQYIIRRETELKRLQEVSPETTLSDNLRCMLLMIFSGLDAKEQQSVLASVNSEYNYKKVTHALKMQFPNLIQRPVVRRDYLGAARGGGGPQHGSRIPWKGQRRSKQVLAAVTDDDQEAYEIDDDDVFQNEAEDYYADEGDYDYEDGYVNYSDDEAVESMLSEFPMDQLENESIAEAFATIAQHRQGFKKKTFGKKPHGSGTPTSSGSVPFKASGDITFDQRAKNQRRAAVDFLKGMTQCTACWQKGHWVGDPECPKGKGKGKGKGKSNSKSPTKKGSGSAKKKPSTNLFVLHDGLESDEENEVAYIQMYDMIPADDKALSDAAAVKYDKVPKNDMVSEDPLVSEYFEGTNDGFTDALTMPAVTRTSECFMVLKDTKLCEHAVYNGGEEKQYHRGANGHTRHITCKQCDRNVIIARRKEPIQLWAYLTQVALCTKWGTASRARGLASHVAQLSLEDDAERRRLDAGEKVRREKSLPYTPDKVKKSQGALPSSPSSEAESWSLVHQHDAPGASSSYPTTRPPKAKIVYEDAPRAWLYGILLSPDDALPQLPELDSGDQKILQPLPGDDSVFQRGPMSGHAFHEIASRPDCDWYCKACLKLALDGQQMSPETFRFVFYLYGRLNLVRASALRMFKQDKTNLHKRTSDPDQLETTRSIMIPLQYDIDNPNSINTHYCDVMMVEDSASHAYILSPEDQRTWFGNSGLRLYENYAWDNLVKLLREGTALGTVIDLYNRTVSFRALEVQDLPLIKTAKGHLAIDLLNFNTENIGELRGFMNEFPQDLEKAEVDDSWASEPATSHEPTQQHQELSSVPQPERPPSQQSDETDYGAYDPTRYPYRLDYVDDPADDEARAHRDFIEMLRQDVEGYEREFGPLPERDALLAEGDHCDDALVFESFVQEGLFSVRKLTNRKGKKIDHMDQLLDSSELNKKIKLCGNNLYYPRKPIVGKVWIKQIFAGQMGITVLAALMGMMVGTPLDSSSTTWDATSRNAMKAIHRDMQMEDPYVTVITHPCGPWGNWSRFNIAKGGSTAETVLHLREESRPLLKTVNKIVKDRIRAKRHVFIEQPLGSESLEEPEMADVKKMLEEGVLVMIVVDGCMVGYIDRESGLPHKKPSYYITSLVTAEETFKCCRCSGNHEHQPLEGANKFGSRTAQAAEWPSTLNRMVIDCIVQQSAVEKSIASTVESEAFPAERRPADQPDEPPLTKRRRRKGRVAILTDNYQAPPVYVRPDGRGDGPYPQPQDNFDPEAVVEDDSSFRASKASELDPILSKSEGQRRYEWLQVDAEIRKIIRDLHVQFGHPTAVTLQRILRRQNAKPEAIRAASLLSCDACGESIHRRRPRPVRLPNRYEFNRHILLDTFYAKDNRGVTYAFLNIVDDATGFQVVSCFGELQGPPASRAVLRHFTAAWSSWAGLPHSLQVDRGKEYMAKFADYLKDFGVEQEVMPLEAPWKGGRCEKAGHLWKQIWVKVVMESNVCNIDDVLTATGIITQTRNSFPRTSGFSPNQWVLGVPELRLPGSLLDDAEAQRIEVLQIRETARVAQVRMDTDSRVRRALLHQSTPTRGPFPVGSYVYFYKVQPQPQESRTFRWFGPGRVIGVELRNPRRLEDEDPPTEGAYWIRYGPSVVLASGEQMRFASEDELLAAHTVPHYAVANQHTRGARSFVDVRPAMGALIPPAEPELQPEQGPQAPAAVPTTLPMIPEVEPAAPGGDTEMVPETPAPTSPQPPGHEYSPTTPDLGTAEQTVLPPPLDIDGEMDRQLTELEPDPAPSPAIGTPRPTPLERAMRSPARLDGHGPVRARDERLEQLTRPPYFTETEVDFWMENCPSIAESAQCVRIVELDETPLSSSSSDDGEIDYEEAMYNEGNPKLVYLTGKAIRSEVSLKSLSASDRLLFDESMRKEWESWNKFQAVKELTEEEIKMLPPDTKVARRMETGIRSDSPTASLLAFNLVISMSVLQKWTLASYDASTAYLQSTGIDRLLILKAPRPPPPGVRPDSLFQALGSIYGTKDAGRSWWKNLMKDAKDHGWKPSNIEPALFMLYEEEKLCGIMASHVDDLITCGSGKKFDESLDKLTVELHLKKKEGTFRFCGKNVVQDEDGKVTIEQVDAIECLDYLLVEKHRRKTPNAKLDEEEKSNFRALIGSMGWISRQTRPDVMVNVSVASQSMGSPTIKDFVELNKAVKMLKESAEFRWTFRPSTLNLENAVIFVCSDSSFANLDGHKSQCGYVVGLTSPEIQEGLPVPILVLETISSSIRRVCRSTLAAEANAFLTGYEAANYLASLLREVMHPAVSLRTLETEFAKKEVFAFTDAKSLESTINKDAGQPSDKRVRILVTQVKEMMREVGNHVIWVDTSQMLADVLTKIGCERELLLQALEPSAEALRQKQLIREGRHRRKSGCTFD